MVGNEIGHESVIRTSFSTENSWSWESSVLTLKLISILTTFANLKIIKKKNGFTEHNLEPNSYWICRPLKCYPQIAIWWKCLVSTWHIINDKMQWINNLTFRKEERETFHYFYDAFFKMSTEISFALCTVDVCRNGT